MAKANSAQSTNQCNSAKAARQEQKMTRHGQICNAVVETQCNAAKSATWVAENKHGLPKKRHSQSCSLGSQKQQDVVLASKSKAKSEQQKFSVTLQQWEKTIAGLIKKAQETQSCKVSQKTELMVQQKG